MEEFDTSIYDKEFTNGVKLHSYNYSDEYKQGLSESKSNKKISIKGTIKKITVMLSSLALIGASATAKAQNNISFKEPAIEYAVRDYLNIDKNKAISEKDLDSITELTILGESIYIINGRSGKIKAESRPTDKIFMYDGKMYPYGDMSEVDDFLLFKNLKEYEVKYNE